MGNRIEISNIQMRDAFIMQLQKKASEDKNIILISNEMGAESLDGFRKELPMQFINAGISEQNIISLAAGMAIEGKRVFIYSIASFITLRCLEQIKIDICSMKLPVTIIGVGASYSYSTDGPTHHATEDISILRSLSGLHIISPCDSLFASSMVDYALKSESPLYIRFDREKLPIFYSCSDDLSLGHKVIHEGEKLCMISSGYMTHKAYEVACHYARIGVAIKVIDLYRLKPLNEKGLKNVLRNVEHIITLEEHTLAGGIGSIISEFIHDHHLVAMVTRCGIKEENVFSYLKRDDAHEKNQINLNSLIKLIDNIINSHYTI